MAGDTRFGADCSQAGSILLSAGSDQSTCADQCALPQCDLVSERCIYADKALRTYLYMTRDDCVSSDEAIVANLDVMTDEAAAPDDNIVAIGRRGLLYHLTTLCTANIARIRLNIGSFFKITTESREEVLALFYKKLYASNFPQSA